MHEVRRRVCTSARDLPEVRRRARVTGDFGKGVGGELTDLQTKRILDEGGYEPVAEALDEAWGGKAYREALSTSVEALDNPDQRIQEDVASFTQVSTTLAVGAVSSLVSLVSFSLILWQLSGPLTLLGVEIPRAMVFIAYLYVIVATVIAFRIGRPLIGLNFLNERFNAWLAQ